MNSTSCQVSSSLRMPFEAGIPEGEMPLSMIAFDPDLITETQIEAFIEELRFRARRYKDAIDRHQSRLKECNRSDAGE